VAALTANFVTKQYYSVTKPAAVADGGSSLMTWHVAALTEPSTIIVTMTSMPVAGVSSWLIRGIGAMTIRESGGKANYG